MVAISDFSVDDLRDLPSPPRIHPNGFVTLDLDETHKLHVWPEEPIRVRQDGQVHDHVFAFRSHILKGALVDQRYHVISDVYAEFCVYVADCSSGRCHTQERPSSGLVRQGEGAHRVRKLYKRTFSAGETYVFPKETFHSSHPRGFTATLMEITDFGTAPSARIVFPKDTEPEHFAREPQSQYEERLVWEAIEHAVI